MALKLDHDDLNQLIEKISTSDIQEFYLEGEDFKLEIKRNLVNKHQAIQKHASNDDESQVNESQITKNDNFPSPPSETTPSVAPPGHSDLLEITSPMVGTFYRASAPGEDPFVEICLLYTSDAADDC